MHLVRCTQCGWLDFSEHDPDQLLIACLVGNREYDRACGYPSADDSRPRGVMAAYAPVDVELEALESAWRVAGPPALRHLVAWPDPPGEPWVDSHYKLGHYVIDSSGRSALVTRKQLPDS